MGSVKPDGQVGDMSGTILCIEDHPVSMELVETQLSYFTGLTLIKASTGAEGVRMAQALLPNLILLDMHLPDISGLEVVRALNELIAKGRLRVILLTADSFSIDVVKAMSLGAHAYWHKPLTLERLQVELPRALQSARNERERGQARDAPSY